MIQCWSTATWRGFLTACCRNLSLALCSAYQIYQAYHFRVLELSANTWHCKKQGLKSSQQAGAMDWSVKVTSEYISLYQNIHISSHPYNLFCALISKSIFSSLKLSPVPKFVILFPFFTGFFTQEQSSLDPINFQNLSFSFLYILNFYQEK